MAKYPPLEGPEPNPFDDTHIRAAEDAVRQLAYVDALIKRCEKCKIPASELRKDCDGLCDFFTNFLAEQKGQSAPLPQPVV